MDSVGLESYARESSYQAVISPPPRDRLRDRRPGPDPSALARDAAHRRIDPYRASLSLGRATGTVAGGNLTQLGEALAGYGRIFKTLYVLCFVDDEPYPRQIKGMRNLNEGRHDLARHVSDGRRDELHRAYHPREWRTRSARSASC